MPARFGAVVFEQRDGGGDERRRMRDIWSHGR